MEFEEINEAVEVLTSFKRSARGTGLAVPEIINWRGRRLRITKNGLRDPTIKGHRMLHRFTFIVDETSYELEFDAESLTWQLLRAAHSL